MKQSFRNEQLHVVDAPTVFSFSFTLRPVCFSSGGSCINKDGTGVLWGIQGKVTKTKLSQKFAKKFRAAKCNKVKFDENENVYLIFKIGRQIQQTNFCLTMSIVVVRIQMSGGLVAQNAHTTISHLGASPRRGGAKQSELNSCRGNCFGVDNNSEIINKVGEEQGERLFQRSGSQEQHTILHVRASRKCLWSP